MKKRKRKKTPEERAADRARRDDLTRRLQAAIERYRTRAEERRKSRSPGGDQDEAVSAPVRKPWVKMSREERAAERARSRDLDRRLLAMIERYRKLNEERRQQAGDSPA